MKYEKLVKNYQIQAPEFIRLAVSMVGAFGEKVLFSGIKPWSLEI